MKKRQRKKSQKKLLELMKTANSFADYQKNYLEMIMSCKRIIKSDVFNTHMVESGIKV